MAMVFLQFFKHRSQAAVNPLQPGLTKLSLIFFMLIVASDAFAYQRILLVQSSTEPVYLQFAHAVREQLKSLNIKTEVQIITADEFSSNPPTAEMKIDYIIAAGIRASQLVAKLNSKKPRLLALIPTSYYESHIKTNKTHCQPGICSVILLDQPLERQLQLIHLALPQNKRVLVIASSPTNSLTTQLTRISHPLGIKINYMKVISDESLISQLTQELPAIDLVLALPDPSIYNKNTARPLILATYKHSVPIFAYSQAFIDAGATLGIYTLPDQFAQQCIELIAENQSSTTSHWPLTAKPKYYTIGINSAVAESLGINLPSIQYLRDQLDHTQQ